MGRYEGVGVKENPISSIQDWQITIFFNVIYINCLETDFMNIPRLRHYIEHLKLVPKQF